MSNLNNIFDNFSYLNLKFPFDFSEITNKLKEENNYIHHADNQLIYGENVDYDYGYSDNSSELNLNSNRVSNTVSEIETWTKTIGYTNNIRLFTGRGDDSIIGLGNATISSDLRAIAQSESTSTDGASADSTAKAIFQATVEATGVKNSKAILTARGDDKIIGLSDVPSTVSAIAEATAIDLSLAKANSQATVVIDVLAIGVENDGNIYAGRGKDLVVGAANTSSQIEVQATALADALNLDLTPEVAEQLNNANSESNSISEAINLATALGIANSGNIFLNQGNDTIFGLATSQSSSDATSDSQTASNSEKIALAGANAEALAAVENFTIGISNRGKIATGWGNDVLTGLAFNQSQANAKADAIANAETDVTDSNTNTNAIADTENIKAIGIDNSAGEIETGAGADRIIAYGSDTGIFGGRINTGNNNDEILAYGASVGVEEAKINLGRGNDYFRAKVARLDPLTGAIALAENQTNSIRNSQVYGNIGNDTFELGGFNGTVAIDGGEDFDTLKLSGDIDSYTFGVDSSQTLTIEDSGSILSVKSVEAIYFSDSEQYSISDFA